ncbi:MAG: hypothetical protein ACK2UW_25690, partial [Anaerolineales bacterium]
SLVTDVSYGTLTLNPDGSYARVKPKSNETQVHVQNWLLHFHTQGERPHRVTLRTTSRKKK